MARRRRVLILYSSPLFGESLKYFLEAEKGLEVMTAEASGPGEPQALLGFCPDVLVVEEHGAPFRGEGAFTQARSPTVINLSLRSNTMRVSYERQVPSADVEDLVRAIKSPRLILQGHKQRQIEKS